VMIGVMENDVSRKAHNRRAEPKIFWAAATSPDLASYNHTVHKNTHLALSQSEAARRLFIRRRDHI
jgi:hypothetical protein